MNTLSRWSVIIHSLEPNVIELLIVQCVFSGLLRASHSFTSTRHGYERLLIVETLSQNPFFGSQNVVSF